MAPEIDPVREVEQTLSREIAQLVRRYIGRGTPQVQAHLREVTLVFLIEGPELPPAEPEINETLARGLGDILRERLGREIAEPPGRTHLSPQSRLLVVRLR